METVSGYTDMTAEEASSFAMKASTLVVDVSPVWTEGHIPGAVSMPLATLEEELAYLGRDREYLIYCHSDSASIQGAETFASNGFSPVYRMKGNYAAWTDAGYPVEMPGYMNVTAEQAKNVIDATGSRIIIVDVSPAYLDGHIAGAVSAPLATLETEMMTMDKSRPYLIYCHTDEASISGAQAFVDAGFNPVHRLEGNYAAWVDAGYPIAVGKEI
ncbi:rhodanese-like domain-containing protein [Methanogenium marinum]|uniref:Rhodanese-like domain-containing protein n=1 Tax=Methanogenium marinum TaxID=348610 RepID=A0A9Q4KW07_9EURY|nr:rhodanese-like domain-containing protein [Methanogenium marinum]MDE4908691.1 rhodanese-like domain-containing protein [Methanogenium marinum]